MTAAAFVTSGSLCPVLDEIPDISLVMRSHIGVRDHQRSTNGVHKRKFPIISPIMTGTLRSATVGSTELIAKVWTA
ncbi:uncharacterized protein EDB91DRAFT_1102170 [Suillus paluster]|uniref:uncharacterized protein n=1 Tax=Suillus paluster TaxID=48578 RepID=UPI001B87625E|nr:uncharacterized protein EDB91DRAFT_1102170 [Suillus paluster]KAG1752381.1 hypothetical protein EDB91DRAFT_1102170 [Suillus paluster]